MYICIFINSIFISLFSISLFIFTVFTFVYFFLHGMLKSYIYVTTQPNPLYFSYMANKKILILFDSFLIYTNIPVIT